MERTSLDRGIAKEAIINPRATPKWIEKLFSENFFRIRVLKKW
jgi:hypothetical protein